MVMLLLFMRTEAGLEEGCWRFVCDEHLGINVGCLRFAGEFWNDELDELSRKLGWRYCF